MTYETIDAYNTSEGMHQIFYYIAETVPGFMPLVLISFWLVATLGSFFAEKRLTGRGNIPNSAAAGSYATAVVTIMFSLIPDLVSIGTIVTAVAMSILTTIWLFMSKTT